MEKENAVYDFTIEPLTAVHIGSGETLTPMDYKLGRSRKSNGETREIYIKFSQDKILKKIINSNNQPLVEELYRASDSGNFKDLQKYFQGKCGADEIEYPCDRSEEFKKIYEKNKDKDPLDNALAVLQMYRPAHTKRPVIPGSSIKGAVRTAVLNSKIANLNVEEFNRPRDEGGGQSADKVDRKIQDAVLKITNGTGRDFERLDPFRCIGFQDITLPVKSQLVACLQNVRTGRERNEATLVQTGMQIIAETIPGRLLGYETKGSGKVTINTLLQQSRAHTKDGEFKIKMDISADEIVRACNEFFKKEFETEYAKFYKNPSEGTDKIVELKKIIKETTENSRNAFVLRLGRWSQIEYVSYNKEPLRKPKTPSRGGKSLGYGGTRTVMEYKGQYLPMGWCVCTLTPAT